MSSIYKVEFDLGKVVHELCDSLAYRAYDKGLELVYIVDEQIPVSVCGDPIRWRQILTNLVGNAIKFTEHGDVIVQVDLESCQEDTMLVRCTVSDTGIGIAPERHGALFTPFVQEDGSTTRRFGGTGLGLAISKQLVELMHGEIGVESARGQGSRFWFTTQLATASTATASTPIEENPDDRPATVGVADASLQTSDHQIDTAVEIATHLSGRNALVAAPSAGVRRQLASLLSRWGCEVELTKSIDDAITRLHDVTLERTSYDFVVVDHGSLCAIDRECINKINRLTQIHGQGVVALALLTHTEQLVALDLEPIQVVMKPVKPDHLLRALLSLATANLSEEVDHGEAAVSSHTPDVVDRDRNYQQVSILLAEDNSANQKVLLAMLRRLGYSADAVGNGLDAVNALKEHAYDLVLMDVEMPVMDGYTATTRIRSLSPKHAHIPIVAMTAHAMSGDRERCIKAGMNDYVSKPILLPDLSATIEQWIHNLNGDIDAAKTLSAAATPLHG